MKTKKIAKIRYRVFATIVDAIICAIGIALILLATSSLSIIKLFFGETAVIDGAILIKLSIVGILIITMLILYFSVVPLYTKGQTVGYFLFKIRMVQVDGTSVNFMTLFVRALLGEFAFFAVTLGIGVIANLVLMLYRKDNCGIHDILSKIIVVDA